jgi:ketosteroid isomerase-like protein
MDALIAVRGAVDRVPTGALGPLLELLAEDVAFEVAGGDGPGRGTVSGRQAVADYFAALGGLVAFWRMEYSAAGGRVIAWVTESFTLAETGLEGEAELALVLDFRLGRVARLSVIEDLSFLPGWDVAGGRPAATRSPGSLQQPLLARGGVGIMGRLLTRPSEHVAAGAPA